MTGQQHPELSPNGGTGHVNGAGRGIAPIPPWSVPLPSMANAKSWPVSPAIVRRAREHARVIMSAWLLSPDEIDNTELIISELVTNSVRASQADWTIAVLMMAAAKSISIAVFDQSPALPTPRQPLADEDSGRGLMLVEALSDEWGSFLLWSGCKVTYAHIGRLFSWLAIHIETRAIRA
jgi:anti-sigma regulatory factor (Ser/Thr protein kinase)